MTNEFISTIKRNGIWVPKKMNPRNRIQKMMVNIFLKRWSEVFKLYLELKCSIHSLEGTEALLKEDWGIEVSTCSPILRFRNPEQAKKVLERETTRMKECEDEVRNLIRSEKNEWVRNIIRNAPLGTSLIVMKNNDYIPDKENAECFDKNSQAGKESCIAECSLVVKWISFNPKWFIPEEGEFDCWDLKPKNCSVQYIS